MDDEIDTDFSLGHRWARQAESARSAGHWQTAIGKHTRAADCFRRCLGLTNNAEATHALNLLIELHSGAAEQIRRYLQLKEVPSVRQSAASLVATTPLQPSGLPSLSSVPNSVLPVPSSSVPPTPSTLTMTSSSSSRDGKTMSVSSSPPASASSSSSSPSPLSSSFASLCDDIMAITAILDPSLISKSSDLQTSINNFTSRITTSDDTRRRITDCRNSNRETDMLRESLQSLSEQHITIQKQEIQQRLENERLRRLIMQTRVQIESKVTALRTIAAAERKSSSSSNALDKELEEELKNITVAQESAAATAAVASPSTTPSSTTTPGSSTTTPPNVPQFTSLSDAQLFATKAASQMVKLEKMVYHLSKQLREEQALRVKQAKVIDKHVERWKSLKQAARKKKEDSLSNSGTQARSAPLEPTPQ